MFFLEMTFSSCFFFRCTGDPLERMLEGPMRESTQHEIILHDQQYDVFMALLEYLYTDRVK